MSEEKLRALLAEARAITQDSLDSNTTGFEAENEVCKCNACERYRSIITRIASALAEPVEVVAESCFTFRGGYVEGVDGSRWWSADLLNRAEEDRDLARSEVAMLKAQLETLLDTNKEGAWMARALDAERERDEARAEVERLQGAYQRGAEAMREAAACYRNALASISLDEYESTSSASEKVHGHARIARKALYGETMDDRNEEAIYAAEDIRALPIPEDKP